MDLVVGSQLTILHCIALPLSVELRIFKDIVSLNVILVSTFFALFQSSPFCGLPVRRILEGIALEFQNNNIGVLKEVVR